MALAAIYVLTLCMSGTPAAAAEPVYVDPGLSESLLLERPAPVYSELARRARVQGTVHLLILVSETGSVKDVKVIRGNPLLDQGAVQSAWQSKYRPYAPQGKAAPFITELEVSFLPDMSAKDYERDMKLAGPYFEQEVKCRDFVNAAQWQQAGETCTANLALADKLGRHRVHEKMRAYQLAALAMLGRQQYNSALEFLKKARNIGNSAPDGDPELAEVLVTMGFAYLKAGRPGPAGSHFTQGEKSLQAAFESARSPILKDRYLILLKKSLGYHAEASEADGDAKEAEKLKKRLATLP